MRPALRTCAHRISFPSPRLFTTSFPLRNALQPRLWPGYTPDPLDPPLHSLPPAVSPFRPQNTTASAPSDPPIADIIIEDEPQSRARVVFGSRLAGPGGARPAATPPSENPLSELIAGVHVPPKPEEPENCCMSGCVHCVWDLWREEMEVWSAASKAARKAAAASEEMRTADGEGGKGGVGQRRGLEYRAQEGRPESSAGDLVVDGKEEEEELFGDVPVGIREFMKTEKKLRERKKAKGKLLD